ncbi:MAG: NAD(P)/FAD-dependent oxidoreductase, partial [Bradyrhizobium sp.]
IAFAFGALAAAFFPRLRDRDLSALLGVIGLVVGGIAFSELDAHFMLRRLPGVFAAGEMLDWEAPTGGYLLQASFATGVAAGKGALQWLKL